MNEQLHPPGMDEDPVDAELRCAWCGCEVEQLVYCHGSTVCLDCEAGYQHPKHEV